ncbi:MAG: hypothetical protein KatS3mg005_1115 [Bryobacteraceae bacterium]|nr:MAG: hypothetical protein KatS3mg005_1115 [Bryobacteraceae bacterium]
MGVIYLFLLLAACSGQLQAQGGGLQPFRLSWFGADANITSFAGWNQPIAVDSPWVEVSEEGHYVLDGRRIRFLGVNVGAATAFPDAVRAEAHAARLARFGFNSVRFHHLEAPWAKNAVLIDYARGSSRELSPERLDRLHYFVAKLAENGIYSNINLLVSREFQRSDGLGDEIAQMEWKNQHILGFFNETALDLHKEHARKLLTAPNPYRDNTPLAQDPAVAFVEIMNENGLVQKWFEGVTDAMPERYRRDLQAKWNEWLRAKYESTEALKQGWGVIDQELGANLLSNGDFSVTAAGWSGGCWTSGLQWTLECHQNARAAASVSNDFNGGPALLLEVQAPGSANWHVQLNQPRLSVESGKIYTFRFWAKASAATPLNAGLQRAHTDWASLAPAISVTLGTGWQQYSITFQSTVTESNARINFNGFGDRAARVWLAQVEFREGGQIGVLPEGASLEGGNVPNVARAGAGATLGQRRDWVRFALDLEKKYWDEMRRYVKEELGYRGVVFATIIANSPPNAQSGMDAMDSHAYWQHPQFPAGQDWSPDNWTVTNVSMVNSPRNSTIAAMARQRVKGKPHNVTEYQHSSPNTYSTEMPLFIAAYGALQDWDGIWFFEYPTGTDEYVTGFFDTGGNPGKMANSLIAASLFRRGDVEPAAAEYAVRFDPAVELNAVVNSGRAWRIADGSSIDVPASLGLVSRVALAVGEDAAGSGEPLPAPPGPVYASDTGQIVWSVENSSGGVLTVDTPATKALLGFTDGGTYDLGGVVIEPGQTRQGWSTIAITARDGAALDGSSEAWGVIVATGDHENTGQIWKNAQKNSVGRNWGRAPALVEVIPARITLPVAPWRVAVWALDENGNRFAEVPVEDADGRARFRIGDSGPTIWYEFYINPE